ncbi:MAG: TonB-dependent receptor, partial [Candidatus Paraprevotella stercoravium]|nr:TonB-dependent receptor [Candidatus Paraprevotella stercoravium]
MKRVTILLFCVLLVCMNAYTQRKVKLKVLENGTEQPIIAANISYADNEAMQNAQYTITDTDGKAVLKLSSGGTWYYKVT